MIELQCEQNSAEWHEARLGIPTASEFKRIVTPTGKLSASRDGYIAQLVAEYFLGVSMVDLDGNEWIERGKALEPEARRYYSFVRDTDVRSVGFCYKDADKAVGCSPDGLEGVSGGLELKCPMAATHLLYLARDALPREYAMQVQGCLWVTGREWWDFMSYFPDLPPLIVRVEPDPDIQAALDKHIPQFVAELEAAKSKLLSMGVQAP